MSRVRCDESLRRVREDLIKMGTLAGEMVKDAVQSALEGDRELGALVVARDEWIDGIEREATERIIATIVLETPVAKDLLFVTSVLGTLGDLEKIGDEAGKLARRAGKLKGSLPEPVRAALREMDRLARENLTAALGLVCEYSDAEARRLIEADDLVDGPYRTGRRAILALIEEHPEEIRSLLRCGEVLKALEHVSDRASDIAKRMRVFHQRVEDASPLAA